MRQYLGHVGAFLLGVVVTVGAYEVARIVTNARQALDAASSRVASAQGDDPPPVARKAVPARAPTPGRRAADVRKGAPAPEKAPGFERRLVVDDRPALDMMQRRAARSERLRERRRRRWEALSPEEQERALALRQARQERRAALGQGAAAEAAPDPIGERPGRDTGL